MVLLGELRLAVARSSPIQVIGYVRQFMDEALLAHVEANELGHVFATVFMDSVPLRIVVRTFADGEDVTVVFKHPSQSDIIRFHKLYKCFVTFLQSLNMQVTTSPQAVAGAWSGLIADDFDNDDDSVDDDAPSWSKRVELVLADSVSSVATVREQAFQCLARWSASAPASHAAIAQSLAKYACQLSLTLVAGSLAEMYPASSMLKNMACGTSPEVQKILSDSELFTVLANLEVSMLPALVTGNLTLAMHSLQKVSDQKQHHQEADITSFSTQCTNFDSVPDCGDIESQSSETSSLEAMAREAMAREVRHKPSAQDSTSGLEMSGDQLQFYNLADNLFDEFSD